jgi:hypothetical protein
MASVKCGCQALLTRLRCAMRAQIASASLTSGSKKPNRMREKGRCSRISSRGSGSSSRRVAATEPARDHVAWLGLVSDDLADDGDCSQRLTVGVSRRRRVDENAVPGRHPGQGWPPAVVRHEEAVVHAAPRARPQSSSAVESPSGKLVHGTDTGLRPILPELVQPRCGMVTRARPRVYADGIVRTRSAGRTPSTVWYRTPVSAWQRWQGACAFRVLTYNAMQPDRPDPSELTRDAERYAKTARSLGL